MTENEQTSDHSSEQGASRPIWTAPVLTIFPADSAESLPTAGPEAVSTS